MGRQPQSRICIRCSEEILDGDDRTSIIDGTKGQRRWQHYECGMRTVIGSVAHIEQRCGCYVDGSTEGDPEGMTKREAALAAWAAWRERHP